MVKPFQILAIPTACALLAACAAAPSGLKPRGFPAEALPIDLERFMGDWYVLAHIPTAPEAQAHEAVESYTLREDGGIDVRFRFCEGGIDGAPRELTMDAWVYDPATRAEWRVRPIWPLRLVYQIAELDPDYQVTVIVNPSGYAWVMARAPELAPRRLEAITSRLAERGFDVSALRRVPHEDGRCGVE